MRLFLALEVPGPIRESLTLFIDEAKRAPKLGDRSAAQMRWARPDGMHLTLRFLGETDLAHAGRIVGHLNKNTRGRFPRMSLRVAGISRFPEHGRPRVLWAGVTQEDGPKTDGRLEDLHAVVEEACAEEGFPPEGRNFHPHITVARLSEGQPPEGLGRFLADVGSTEFGHFEAESLTLFQSILSPQGAAYRAMETVAL